MTDKTITDLTALTAPVAADEIGIWDVSAAQYKKITRETLVGGTITGVGTLATGGFTLTVPATGTAALRGTANTFTAVQTITPATPGCLVIGSFDNGSGGGPRIEINRNTNAGTPAAGCIRLIESDGDDKYVWADAAGNLRIYANVPTNANDTAGTVVGAQTSMAEAKHIYAELSPLDEVLRRIADGADAVRTFAYRSGAFNRQRFEGVVTDYAPDYGMDRDAEHPAGKSLNEIQIAGDLLRAVAYLARRVAELERLTPGRKV